MHTHVGLYTYVFMYVYMCVCVCMHGCLYVTVFQTYRIHRFADLHKTIAENDC
jgi:hypothetical protein